ncbi:MAG TPA: hypothetical protein VF085_04550 [Solirubrobacterales bacterium]
MAEGREIRTSGADDAMIEAAVLRQLLDLHPIQLTLAELIREIVGESTDFAQTDAVKRAVRQLTAVGLVNCNGDVVLPSRAALRFYELFE